MIDLSLYTRVYVGRGQKAHLMPNESYQRHKSVPCGTAPVWFDPDGWKGTGSQDETEKAEAMDLCKRCVMVLEGTVWK